MCAADSARTPAPAIAPPEYDLAQTICNALQGIRFGSVEIIIHDAQVVQIERKEKIRLETATRKKGR
ncbi:MAG: hypothetical protein DKINENOH_00533 [bacterium]|nr:hypothetical protein [bacterium]